jgi:hypothetical protein
MICLQGLYLMPEVVQWWGCVQLLWLAVDGSLLLACPLPLARLLACPSPPGLAPSLPALLPLVSFWWFAFSSWLGTAPPCLDLQLLWFNPWSILDGVLVCLGAVGKNSGVLVFVQCWSSELLAPGAPHLVDC